MTERLSPREKEILRLIAAGKTTKEISAQLSIAESTVNWHVGNVLSKLGAASRAGAVATALRGDLLNSADPRVGPGAAGRGRWVQGALRFAGAFLLVALVLVAGFATAATIVGTINVDNLRPGTTASPRATEVVTPRAATPSAAPASSSSPGSVAPQGESPSEAPGIVIGTAAPIPAVAPSVATASLPAAPTLPSVAPSLVPVPIPTAAPIPTLPPVPSIVPPLPTPSLPVSSLPPQPRLP